MKYITRTGKGKGFSQAKISTILMMVGTAIIIIARGIETGDYMPTPPEVVVFAAFFSLYRIRVAK